MSDEHDRRIRLPFRLTTAILAASYAFERPPAKIPEQLTCAPYRSSGIYNIGETVGWTVTPGPEQPAYAFQ